MDEKDFSEFLNNINTNGLFSDLGTVERYKLFYKSESESKMDKMESFPRSMYRKNFFRVYSVL